MYRGSKIIQFGIVGSFFLVVVNFTYITKSYAHDYYDKITQAVEAHNTVAAARSDVDAARQRVRVAKGDWFPELEISASTGYEVLNKPSLAKTKTNFTETSLKITQLLWDFGATNARVEKSRLRLLRSELVLFQTRQDIMLEAATAAIQFRSAIRVLSYARKSESNVRRQTGLEEARVRVGGGVSTDVLQAKTQLAGAQARSIQALGQRSTSLNRYLKLFRTAPASLKEMAILDLVVHKLPKSLSGALKIAYRLNPQIRIASVDEVLARQTVKEAKGDDFFPRIEAVGKTKINNDVSGTSGRETGSSVLIQLRMPFNLGFTSINTLRANQSEVAAASYRVANARLEVEEAVRNAWSQYNTARSTAGLLRDQASLANAFLQNARKERQLGSRSLIDVLAGESALFNAKSDTISTDADVLVASFQLLNATGQFVGSKPASHKVKN